MSSGTQFSSEVAVVSVDNSDSSISETPNASSSVPVGNVSLLPDTRIDSCASTIVAHHDSAYVDKEADDLNREIQHDEDAVASYGADDPHNPPTNKEEPFKPETRDPVKVTWDGPDDPENPQNWSYLYKWFLTLLSSLLTLNVTFASSAPSSGIIAIKSEFGITSEIAYLVTSVFLFGYIFGPIIWAPGSELFGRRPIFLVSILVYCLFSLGQAQAHNIETLLVTRFLSGVFASAPLTNSGGVVVDIWDPVGRGAATSVFTASVFIGPVLGPIAGGYLVDSSLGWRWIFWLMIIFSGFCWVLAVIFIPETYAPVLLQKKARRLRKQDPVGNAHVYAEHEKQDFSFKKIVSRTLFRPFNMLMLEPILVLITVYLSLVYGLLYALFEAFPIIFIVKRGFTLGQNGLAFIAVGLGAILGSLINYFLTLHYPRLMKKWRGHPPPEQRLFGAMIAGPSLVIGVFWLGWTGNDASISWVAPAVGAILVGLSISLIFISFLSYVVDTYLMYAASALGANTICRSAVAAVFPLFTVQMFTKMGVGYASTLIGCVVFVLMPSPFLFYRYGAAIRQRSKFAPCIDLKIKKQIEEEEAAHERGELKV